MTVSLAAALGDDQVARMRRRLPLLLAGGEEQRLHRLGDGLARGHMDERAVLEERGVQRGEGAVIGAGVAEEVCLDQRRRRSASACSQAGRSSRPPARAERRKLGREMAVDEHQPVPGKPGEGKAASASGGDAVRGRARARAGTGSLAMGATLVKRQSSSCSVGKPSSAKRAMAALRAARNPGWVCGAAFAAARTWPSKGRFPSWSADFGAWLESWQRFSHGRARLAGFKPEAGRTGGAGAAAQDPVVALLLQFERQFLAAGLDDAAVARARARSPARCSSAGAGSA